MEEEIKLTNLINLKSLQLIQDAFCDICNISVSIRDEHGVNITKPSMASEFCTEYNKK